MELAGPVIQLLQWISAPISRCWKYHCGLQENVKTLNQRMEELDCRRNDINARLGTEIVEGETKLKDEVQHWLQSVEKIDAEINTINQQVETVKCFSRAGIGGSGIKEVPQGMENLCRLRYLGFNRCDQLKLIPDGILCKLSNLQYLSLGGGDCETKIREEELVKLTKLEELYCRFYDLQRFNAYIRFMADGGPTHYTLQFGSGTEFVFKKRGKAVNLTKSDLRKSVAVDGDCPVLLPQNVETLALQECCIDVSSLCEMITSTNLRVCSMKQCHGLEHLFVYSSSINTLLQRLEVLRLRQVRDLRGLIRRENVASSPLPPVTFSSLKTLRVNKEIVH